MKRVGAFFLLLFVSLQLFSQEPVKLPPRITLSMIVHNEADHYLRRVLEAAKEYITDAVIIDDASTDKTVAVCEEVLRGIPLRIIRNKESKFANEWVLRKQQWDETVKTNPEWILVLDADQIFEKRFARDVKQLLGDPDAEVYYFRWYDFWDEEHYRDDIYWSGHLHYYPQLVRYKPGVEYRWKETAQHCGHFPLNIAEFKGKASDLRLKHYGWAKEEDRIAKCNRYKKLDPDAKFGSKEQYESILDKNPHLVQWTESVDPLRHGITYERTAGRFGDKMLGYAQARYLSYLTGLPFLCHPFEYSEYLTIEYQAFPIEQQIKAYTQAFHVHSADTLAQFFKMMRDPQTPPTLFLVDYFPSDVSEWDWPETWWTAALQIPWGDEPFASYLRSSLQPRIPIPQLTVNGRLNVADHIRALSGADRPETSILSFPLKVPNLNYHERQIRRVYEWNLKKPMHVFIFSDSKTPLLLLEEMRSRFKTEDILFNIQVLEQPDVKHVIQDFFGMQKFDVLISTQSNFSIMASRLGTFEMVILPVHSIGKYPDHEIDRVQLITKPSSWFPYTLNVTLREGREMLPLVNAPDHSKWSGIYNYLKR